LERLPYIEMSLITGHSATVLEQEWDRRDVLDALMVARAREEARVEIRRQYKFKTLQDVPQIFTTVLRLSPEEVKRMKPTSRTRLNRGRS
jgi:hypothetical protein